MKNFKILILISTMLNTLACKSQDKETYWVTKNITKADGKPFWGITSAYMDMIAEMQIHLTKNGDSLLIAYPFEQKIKLNALKSITNVRIKDSGELLDSVYEVKIENDVLKIKFKYLGSGQDEKDYSLNLVQVDQQKYSEAVKNLKNNRERLLSNITPIDFSKLKPALPNPSYFKEKAIINAANPIQLADELVDNDSTVQMTTDFDFKIAIAKQPKEAYKVLAIQNADKIHRVVAHIGKVNFGTLMLINNAKKPQSDLVMLTKRSDNKTFQELYQSINSAMPNAKIAVNGLPKYDADKKLIDLEDFISISWMDDEKTVKLLVDLSLDYYTEHADDETILPFDEKNPTKLKSAFKHYLDLIDHARVRVFIVSKPFDDLIKQDKDLVGIPTTLADYLRW